MRAIAALPTLVAIMSYSTKQAVFLRAILPLVVLFATVVTPAAEGAKPPKEPAKITLSVDPGSVAPGGSARVTVELAPMHGVKIKKYPKIQFKISAQEGLVEAAEVSLGDDALPPGSDLEDNAFKVMKPLHLTIKLDQAAPAGTYELDAKVTYAYCVSASGFCARKRERVKIPISVQ